MTPFPMPRMLTNFKKKHAIAVAGEMARLLANYTKRLTEQDANLLVYGFLSARLADVRREWRICVAGRKHPLRIDFRIGGTNPAVVEFALRPKTGHGTALSVASNVDELKKLGRVSSTKARWRYLLLIDLRSKPLVRAHLKGSYDAANLGVGRFPRESVRVIYAHRTDVYDFLFSPRSK